jgi:hypothetical protein
MKRKDHTDGHTLRRLCLTNAARRSLAPADLKTEAIDWLRMPSQTNKIIQAQQFLELLLEVLVRFQNLLSSLI